MNEFYPDLSATLPNSLRSSTGMTFDQQAAHQYPPTYAPVHQSSASSFANLQYLFGVQDPATVVSKGGRNRRRSAHGNEPVKHRRTRSGCYTCRSRRVKCDEKRPLCDRCKKGGRDCVYPEPAGHSTKSSAANKGSSSTTHESPGSSEDDFEEEHEGERLEVIHDEDEGDQSSRKPQVEAQGGSQHPDSSHQRSTTRHSSETPSLDKGPSPSPSTEGSVGWNTNSSRSKAQESADGLRNDWSHLPHDLQFYLVYFFENVTYHHYSFKYDSSDFLRTHFLDAALRNDALLHAIVGFSAFQHTLNNPNGKIQDFLQYYNKAVSLLLRSLQKSSQRHTVGTLLTILQLATIEEYLGDWINLLGHQKAAYEILTGLYTPETVMHTDLSRMILNWYCRFDVFAGLMGGFETVLSKEWFSSCAQYLQQRIIEEPDKLEWKFEEAISKIRLIAMDMSMLFAKMGKGEIDPEQFMVENETVSQAIFDWNDKMDPALKDPRWLVSDFSGARRVDPDDIIDPYQAGILYHGPLSATNFIMIDWYSIDLMHKYQTALILGTQPSEEFAIVAYASCQLFEAVEFFPESPKGSIVACQASLGIASLFLPRDKRHAMWCRRKLASIETQGYIYPLTFRTKMAALFDEPSCMKWWLPNDENYPPMIRSIRNFVEERTSQARDVPTEDLRDMKAIFASLKLDNGKTSLNPPMAAEAALAQQALYNKSTEFVGNEDLEDLDFMTQDQDGTVQLQDDGISNYWQSSSQ